MKIKKFRHSVLDNIEASILAGFAGVGFVLFAYDGVTVSLGVKVFYVGIVAGSIVSYPAAKRIVEYLYSVPSVYLVTLDATKADYDFSVHEISKDYFSQLTVKGEDYELESVNAGSPVYIAESFDQETMRAEGVWTASVSSREMLVERGIIREIRQELESDAKDVFKLRSKISSIVRQTFEEVMMESLRVQEKEQIFHGESIDAIIEEKLSVEIEDEVDSVTHNPGLEDSETKSADSVEGDEQ
jgi:hypothetical protein